MSWHRFFRRNRADADLMGEIESYIAEETAENRSRGMAEEEAKRQARIKFGNPVAVREELWQQNRIPLLDSLVRDLRYAARTLLRTPKFTATVLLTLALGIGANAAIFSVVSAVLVRQLPIRDPQNVVVLHDQFPTLNLPRTTVSVLQFRDFSQRTDLFQSAAVLKETNLTLTGQGQALRLQGMQATSQLFSLLGVRPELGRDFTNQDDTYGSARVVLLSHGLWRRFFGRDRAVVGRQLRLDTKSYQITGVLPKGIEALYPHVEVWVPAAFDAESLNPKFHWYVGYTMLARLATGVNLQRGKITVLIGVVFCIHASKSIRGFSASDRISSTSDAEMVSVRIRILPITRIPDGAVFIGVRRSDAIL